MNETLDLVVLYISRLQNACLFKGLKTCSESLDDATVKVSNQLKISQKISFIVKIAMMKPEAVSVKVLNICV